MAKVHQVRLGDPQRKQLASITKLSWRPSLYQLKRHSWPSGTSLVWPAKRCACQAKKFTILSSSAWVANSKRQAKIIWRIEMNGWKTKPSTLSKKSRWKLLKVWPYPPTRNSSSKRETTRNSQRTISEVKRNLDSKTSTNYEWNSSQIASQPCENLKKVKNRYSSKR